MDKFLIFQTADNDCIAHKLSDLASVEGGDSTLQFTFLNTSAASADQITLTMTAGADEMLAMQEVAQAINEHPHSDGAIVIGDDINRVFAISNPAADAVSVSS